MLAAPRIVRLPSGLLSRNTPSSSTPGTRCSAFCAPGMPMGALFAPWSRPAMAPYSARTRPNAGRGPCAVARQLRPSLPSTIRPDTLRLAQPPCVSLVPGLCPEPKWKRCWKQGTSGGFIKLKFQLFWFDSCPTDEGKTRATVQQTGRPLPNITHKVYDNTWDSASRYKSRSPLFFSHVPVPVPFFFPPSSWRNP